MQPYERFLSQALRALEVFSGVLQASGGPGFRFPGPECRIPRLAMTDCAMDRPTPFFPESRRTRQWRPLLPETGFQPRSGDPGHNLSANK